MYKMYYTIIKTLKSGEISEGVSHRQQPPYDTWLACLTKIFLNLRGVIITALQCHFVKNCYSKTFKLMTKM